MNKFLCSKKSINEAEIVLIGIPFDATSSFRAGSRFSPDLIRLYSESIESYSPYFDFDLEDVNFFDTGNIEVTINNYHILEISTVKLVEKYLSEGKKILAIGGEHLISLPIIKAYKKFFKNLIIIQLDAHTDLRDTYFNEKYSHATVMKRVCEIVGNENIYQFGIRSGTKEEFEFAKNNTNFYPYSIPDINNFLDKFSNSNIYLTLDIDVLDPSLIKGTGNPEPNGIFYDELIKFLIKMKDFNVVGADLVELSPEYDSSGVSTIVAAEIVRELLILLKN